MNEQIELTAIDRYRGCLLGLACGDAVGTTVEFMPRGTFRPLVDMQGGGPFGLKPGEWTDDTSMALCLATSLVHKGGFDPVDQMNRYCNWRSVGYMSSNGECFDIGMTVAAALDRFICSGDPFAGSLDSRSAGNGALMRLAPYPCFTGTVLRRCSSFRQRALELPMERKRPLSARDCLDCCSGPH